MHDDLAEEKVMLRNKISQYAELSAYEKYLNELHHALEIRN